MPLFDVPAYGPEREYETPPIPVAPPQELPVLNLLGRLEHQEATTECVQQLASEVRDFYGQSAKSRVTLHHEKGLAAGVYIDEAIEALEFWLEGPENSDFIEPAVDVMHNSWQQRVLAYGTLLEKIELPTSVLGEVGHDFFHGNENLRDWLERRLEVEPDRITPDIVVSESRKIMKLQIIDEELVISSLLRRANPDVPKPSDKPARRWLQRLLFKPATET